MAAKNVDPIYNVYVTNILTSHILFEERSREIKSLELISRLVGGGVF